MEPETIPPSPGKRLKLERVRRDLTQAEAAKLLQVNRNRYGLIEGNRLGAEDLRLAEAYRLAGFAGASVVEIWRPETVVPKPEQAAPPGAAEDAR